MRSFFVRFFVLSWLVFLVGGNSQADSPKDEVSVDTNRRTYLLGDRVQIMLDNQSGEAIFIPGCQSIQVERFGDERYELLPGELCIAEGEARALASGVTEFSFEPRKEHLGPPLRISIVYGIGCSGQRPLSQARCKDFGTVYTPSFRVRDESKQK